MAILSAGDVVTLSGAHGQRQYLAGVFRATRDLDLDALVAEHAAAADGRSAEWLPPLRGEVGQARAVADFHAWLVAQGHLARVEAKSLEVRTVTTPQGDGVRVDVAVPVARGIGPALLDAWSTMADALVRRSRHVEAPRAPVLRPYLNGVAAILERHGLRWDDAAQAEVSARYVLPTLGGWAHRRDLPFDAVDAVQVLRLAWAVATDAPELVPPGERGFAATALRQPPTPREGRVPDGFVERMTAPDPRPATQPEGPVTVAFPYVGQVSRGRPALNLGRHVVEPVDASLAPVVARLASDPGAASSSSGTMLLRSMDGVLLRQVLSPGSWEPMGVDAFADAVARGAAWRDNPFHAASGRHVMGPVDVALASRRDLGDAGGAAAASDRAGRLVVVDGTVHRTCAGPSVSPWHLPRPGRRVPSGMTWAFEDGPSGVLDPDTSGLRGAPAADLVTAFSGGWTSLLCEVPLCAARLLPGVLARMAETFGDDPLGDVVGMPDLGVLELAEGALPGGGDPCRALVEAVAANVGARLGREGLRDAFLRILGGREPGVWHLGSRRGVTPSRPGPDGLRGMSEQLLANVSGMRVRLGAAAEEIHLVAAVAHVAAEWAEAAEPDLGTLSLG